MLFSSPFSSPTPSSRPSTSGRSKANKLARLSSLCLLASGLIGTAEAATKEQWRGRTIYQLITDRFAPPSSTAPALTSGLPKVCDPNAQTWCGGTWRSIIDKLDYIQNMGMTAIWISPVQENLDSITDYNFAYHGYWVTDQRKLNPRFGSHQDLLDLSAALHARDMYLMVDIVVNNVPSLRDPVTQTPTGETLAADGYWFTDPAMYHPYCPVDYSNATSAEQCWLGDTKLALMDVNTEHPTVVTSYQNWIKEFVQTYSIDGLRIDAAKHVREDFWPGFCEAAGVFCIGEVFAHDMPTVERYGKNMDAIMNYPVYDSMMQAFQLPGPANMSALVETMKAVNQTMPDTHVLGTFIENHDLPRFANTTVDPQLQMTALAFQFVTDGIPIVYYGQEQQFHGIADPSNREALWPSNYVNTTQTWQIAQLNQLRKHLEDKKITHNGLTFNQASASIVAADSKTVAIRKGPVLSMLTTRGAPPVNETFAVVESGWDRDTVLVDIFSCEKFTVGSQTSLAIAYNVRGGRPVVTVPLPALNGSGICDFLQQSTITYKVGGNSSIGAGFSTIASSSVFLLSALTLAISLTTGLL